MCDVALDNGMHSSFLLICSNPNDIIALIIEKIYSFIGI